MYAIRPGIIMKTWSITNTSLQAEKRRNESDGKHDAMCLASMLVSHFR